MNNLLTIIVLLFLILSIRKGYQIGFFKKVLSLLSLIISVILTRIFTPQVVLLVKDYTNIKPTISNALYNSFKNTNTFDNVDISRIQNIFNLNSMNESIKEFISNTVTEGILTVVCGIVTFIAFVILLKIIFRLLDFIDFVPIVGTLNKYLGGVFGLIEGVFLLWILFLIIRCLTIIPEIKMLEESINKSFLVGHIYNNNLIYNFFIGLFSSTNV